MGLESVGGHLGLWEEGEWGRVERQGVRDEKEAHRIVVIITTTTR